MINYHQFQAILNNPPVFGSLPIGDNRGIPQWIDPAISWVLQLVQTPRGEPRYWRQRRGSWAGSGDGPHDASIDLLWYPLLLIYLLKRWFSVRYVSLLEGSGGLAPNHFLHPLYDFPEVSFFWIYHLVILHSHGKSLCLIGKPSINERCPMAMLNNQRVNGWYKPSPNGRFMADGLGEQITSWGWTPKDLARELHQKMKDRQTIRR